MKKGFPVAFLSLALIVAGVFVWHASVRALSVPGNPPSPPDTAPSVPTNLMISNATQNSMTISWATSTDIDGDAVSYVVYRNNAQVGSPSAPSYTDWGLAPGTTYTYYVMAADPAGNLSASSSPINGTTLSGNAPTVMIVSPIGGTVSSTITVSAAASSTNGIAKVEMYLNGTLFGADAQAPYNFVWNTASSSNGGYSLMAKAYDSLGNTATSSAVNVMVQNDIQPPVTSIVSPQNGDVVSSTVTVSAAASDDTSVSKVEFYIDNSLAGTDYNQPYNFTWDTTQTGNTTHSLTTLAYDPAGNIGISAVVNVMVRNTAPFTISAAVICTSSHNAEVEVITSAPAISQIFYGTTKNYGYITNQSPPLTVAYFNIPNLSPNMVYHYESIAIARGQVARTSDQILVTSGGKSCAK